MVELQPYLYLHTLGVAGAEAIGSLPVDMKLVDDKPILSTKSLHHHDVANFGLITVCLFADETIEHLRGCRVLPPLVVVSLSLDINRFEYRRPMEGTIASGVPIES